MLGNTLLLVEVDQQTEMKKSTSDPEQRSHAVPPRNTSHYDLCTRSDVLLQWLLGGSSATTAIESTVRNRRISRNRCGAAALVPRRAFRNRYLPQ